MKERDLIFLNDKFKRFAKMPLLFLKFNVAFLEAGDTSIFCSLSRQEFAKDVGMLWLKSHTSFMIEFETSQKFDFSLAAISSLQNFLFYSY